MIRKKKKERRLKMKKIGNWFYILILVFLASNAWSANVKIEAQTDRDKMGIGDSFAVQVTISSDQSFDLPDNFGPAKVAGLELIDAVPGGRQSSSSMTIVNGKTQFVHRTVQEVNFVMSPQKEGTFLIPGVEITIAGQTYKSNPLKIEVQEQFRNAGKTKKDQPQFPRGYGKQNTAEEDNTNPFGNLTDEEDLFDQLLKQQQKLFGAARRGQPLQDDQQVPSRQLKIDPNEVFFVHLDLDKTTVYEGEQITAKWYIYTRSDLESLDRVKFPDLRGFWKEIIEEVPSLQFSYEYVNGVRYKKALLASHALFPIKPGKATIDPFKIKAKTRNLTQFGWGQAREYTKISKPAEITVLPLPEEGKTQSFSGAVGNYRVTIKTDEASYPSHQPFSIKVRYEGFGNAKLIDLPSIQWPEGLEIYDTKSDSKFFKDGQSYKEFEILAIPRKEGELKIPALHLTYFDPSQKKYKTESTEAITLNITRGQLGDNKNSDPISVGKNAIAAEFKPQAILELPNAGFNFAKYRWIFYLCVLLFGFVFISSYFSFQLYRLRPEPLLAIDVKNKLNLVEKYYDANDHRKIGSEAMNLIYILVAHLAGQKRADQEIHILINEIPTKDQKQYVQLIMQLFDYFQLIGFSPEEIKNATLAKQPISEQIGKLKKLAEEIVDKIRKEDKNNM